MKMLRAELERNFTAFSAELPDLYNICLRRPRGRHRSVLGELRPPFVAPGRRSLVLEGHLSPGALSFYTEAQNDALLSHFLARIGAWRSSLQALRSVLENSLFSWFYKDHPVELQLWEIGKHSPPISSFVGYMENHPCTADLPDSVTGMSLLSSEYSTLSRAVHASAKSFRMTGDKPFPALVRPEKVLLSKWVTREKRVLLIVNLLLMCLYRADLQGSRLRDLRKSISLVVPGFRYAGIRSAIGVRLFKDDV